MYIYPSTSLEKLLDHHCHKTLLILQSSKMKHKHFGPTILSVKNTFLLWLFAANFNFCGGFIAYLQQNTVYVEFCSNCFPVKMVN